ncbi:MATE family efflux transporter [Paenibacillus sp. FSL M8-0334]|uniref:Probable multidrug resistance protein NorM n=1 Tax=Paenibacillus campinasensis TaxID=66347 RepID=A0ABW9SYM3_9BACL|nr:MATE family efflux transporter [Paenibacillus campinasensis]MUG65562.1 MATE family efflux transporter [Paenibacillus campinasensis]
MLQTTTMRGKMKQFAIILIPILITQLALSAISFFDTNMSGRFSSVDLAGVAIATSLWLPVQTGLSGILIGITPIVSQLMGRREEAEVPYQVNQALWLSAALALIVIGAGYAIVPSILNSMRLEPEVHRVVIEYLTAISFGIIPLFAYTVLRSFIDALGQTRTSMIITLISLPVNVVLNAMFIYGLWFFPRLGGVGAGVASAITYWIVLMITILIVHRVHPFSDFGMFRKLSKASLSAWKGIMKIGVPIGFSIFFETAVFAAVTLLMSSFNTMTIAAHQAAMNFASTLYMLPLSICMSLTIVVGFEAGSGRMKDARQYAKLGIGLAVLLSLATAIILLVAGRQVAGLYSSEPEVIALIQQFLLFAIFFQISDAIATPTQGALRGYKDVNVAFVLAFLSYWVIGLPVGYVLANFTELEAFGYWIGLITGLAVGATLMLLRLVKVQRKFEREASGTNTSQG